MLGYWIVTIILFVLMYLVFPLGDGSYNYHNRLEMLHDVFKQLFEGIGPSPEEKAERKRRRRQRRWRRELRSLKRQQAAQERKDRQTLEDEISHSLAIYQEMVNYMYENPGATVDETVRHVGRSRYYPIYDEEPEWTGRERR